MSLKSDSGAKTDLSMLSYIMSLLLTSSFSRATIFVCCPWRISTCFRKFHSASVSGNGM